MNGLIVLAALLFPSGAVGQQGRAPEILVTNEAELRAAADRVGDVVVCIDRPVKVTQRKPITFGYRDPQQDAVIRIVGLNDTAAIDLVGFRHPGWTNMNKPDEKPKVDDPTGNAASGLCFRGSQVFISNLSILNYQDLGSAVRVMGVSRLFMITDCRLENIGSEVRAFRNGRPTHSGGDAVYSQVIGAFDQSCSLVITHNRFVNCVTNVPRWAHCVYADAPAMAVSHNTFEKCGNPWAMTGGRGGAVFYAHVVGNDVRDPSAGPHPTRDQLDLAWLGGWVVGMDCCYALNRVEGRFQLAWLSNGAVPKWDRSRLHVFGNDYSRMSISDQWAVINGVGLFDWKTWAGMGFDRWSKAPMTTEK